MPGLGKSGTSRINDFRWSILSFDSKLRIRPGRIKIDLFQLIYDGPLRSRGEIVFERLNTHRWSFHQRYNRSIRTIANVPDNLVPRSSALREETISNSLHLASYQEL